MTNILVYDTETTGLPARNRPYNDPDQPHLVQLGAILFDQLTGLVRAEVNFVIDPQGEFTIPDRVAEVHGITTEIAARCGVPRLLAMSAFHQLARKAQLVVCHNIGFDTVIMQIAYERIGKAYPLRDTEQFCTMQAMTRIMQLPPTERMLAARMDHLYKAPTLVEASRFIGRPAFPAHDGMADAREALELYRWLQSQKETEAA